MLAEAFLQPVEDCSESGRITERYFLKCVEYLISVMKPN